VFGRQPVLSISVSAFAASVKAAAFGAEERMRGTVVAIALLVGLGITAHAEDKKPAGTAKGAAVGALAGHEIGSGHAVAGAATGAAIGHHQQSKDEKEQAAKK
jgi:outer membrane lipoprotein SlyB